MKKRLTDRQLEILISLQDYFKQYGLLPPLQYLADTYGMNRSGAADYFRIFVARGYLEKLGHGKYIFAEGIFRAKLRPDLNSSQLMAMAESDAHHGESVVEVQYICIYHSKGYPRVVNLSVCGEQKELT